VNLSRVFEARADMNKARMAHLGNRAGIPFPLASVKLSESIEFDFRNERYRWRPETESFLGNFHCGGRRMRRAAAIIFALLVGSIVMVAGISEMYDKCGPLCWQGLLQAQRERY
jgi:hypothetical protein